MRSDASLNAGTRVVRLTAPARESDVLRFEERLAGCEAKADCRVVLVEVAQGVQLDLGAAGRLAALFRSSPRVIVAVLDGRYGSAGMSLASGADLVVASDETSIEIEPAGLGYHDSWFPNLPLRDLKWLSLCAGAIAAPQLMKAGFLNFTYPRPELAGKATELGDRIARVPSDLLTVKKRAHDTRHRLPLSNHGR